MVQQGGCFGSGGEAGRVDPAVLAVHQAAADGPADRVDGPAGDARRVREGGQRGAGGRLQALIGRVAVENGDELLSGDRRVRAEQTAAEALEAGCIEGHGTERSDQLELHVLVRELPDVRAGECEAQTGGGGIACVDGEQAVVRQLIERIGHLAAVDRGVRTADDGGDRDLRVLLDVHGHDDLLHALQHRCDAQGR